MSDHDDHKEQRLGLWLVGGAAALATAATLFFSVWGWESGKIEGSPNDGQTAAAAYDHSSAPRQLADDAAAVFVENGIVKFYFATGKSDLAAGAEEALKDVLAGVKNGRKAVVSGFHDSTGNQAFNEQLSKDRALVVKNALMGLGVAEGQIELRKPADTEGSGSNAQARRVEVVLE